MKQAAPPVPAVGLHITRPPNSLSLAALPTPISQLSGPTEAIVFIVVATSATARQVPRAETSVACNESSNSRHREARRLNRQVMKKVASPAAPWRSSIDSSYLPPKALITCRASRRQDNRRWPRTAARSLFILQPLPAAVLAMTAVSRCMYRWAEK